MSQKKILENSKLEYDHLNNLLEKIIRLLPIIIEIANRKLYQGTESNLTLITTLKFIKIVENITPNLLPSINDFKFTKMIDNHSWEDQSKRSNIQGLALPLKMEK